MIFKRPDTTNNSFSLAGLAWKRMKKNPSAMFGLTIIVLAIIVSVLGYLITPDSTPFANEQNPELLIREPGFRATLLLVKKNAIVEKKNWFGKMVFGQNSAHISYPFASYRFSGPDIWVKSYSENPESATEERFNIAEVVYAIKPGTSIEFDSLRNEITFTEMDAKSTSVKKTEEIREILIKENIITRCYYLGSDILGRDLLSRVLIGTRISLTVGLIAVIISILVGVLLGALAGYFRGTTDAFIMWFANVTWSIPTILLVIAITLAMGEGITQVFVAVGLTMWVQVTRQVRGQIFSIREKEFVEAGRALGYSNTRIIFKHILPNIYGQVIISAADNFATAILVEAGLSFLGLGTQPPMPSWGGITNDHRGYILMDKAYLAFIPGVAIMLLVLAFMLVGNGLRDAMDTRAVDEKPVSSA